MVDSQAVRRITIRSGVLIYAAMVGINFAPSVVEIWGRAFAPAPLGVSISIWVSLAQTLCFPLVLWFFYHGVWALLFLQRQGIPGLVRLIMNQETEAATIRSFKIALLGFVSFLVVAGAWVAWAAYRGA